MKKKWIWIISALVLLIIILVALSKAGVIGKDEGIKVTAEKVQTRTIIETVNASGKVFPEIEVKVSPDISGEIIDLLVQEGDTVKRGQVLARIYADIYASQRDQAAAVVAQSKAQVSNSRSQLGALKATLDQAESNYKRQKTLLDQKVISQAEFEQAQQTFSSAQANYRAASEGIRANQASVQGAMASLNRANKDVSRATVTAPMDGVISLLAVKKGERVVGTAQMAGTEMLRIADLASIEVQVDVGENDIPKVKIGDTAIVEIDAFNNRKFKGIVFRIANPVINSATSLSSSTTVTNYQVHIRLLPDTYNDLIVKGQPFPFRPNMTASADIQTKTKMNVLAVPLNAVTTRDKNDDISDDKKDKKNDEDDEKKNEGTAQVNDNNNDDDDDEGIQEVVFVLQKDGTVKKYPVKTDIQDINYIEIISGVKVGDEVITGPYDIVSKDLSDGTKVSVVSKDDLIKEYEKP